MNDLRIEAIENQVRQMKKETRRFTRLLVCSIAVTLLTFLAGFQPARVEVVEAGQFVLKGKDGGTQAKLFMNDHGLPTLAFYDKKGKSRVEVGIWKIESGLFVFDEAGEANAHLGANVFGASQLLLKYPGRKQLHLMAAKADANGTPFTTITMGDVDGINEFEIYPTIGISRP